MQKKSYKRRTTSFQKKVYDVVKLIPKGQVRTYKEVADMIGSSFAFRAVGSALNKNMDPSVPCHRVIRSDGKVGGFRDGSDVKREMLKKEGAI